VIPFAAQQRGQSLRAAVDDYHARAEGKASVDYAFHMIVADPTPTVLKEELPALIDAGYTSFKIYMTYDDMKLDDGQILRLLAVARKHGALAMVHAENADCIAWLTEALESAARSRRSTTRRRGRWRSSARRRTAPSRCPSWSTCRS
jgi:dihydropyrimidinase